MRTILVPTDFSACSAIAVKYAILFAEKTDRKLLFFHSTFLLIPTRSSSMAYMLAVNSNKTAKLNALKKFIGKVYLGLNMKRNEANTKFHVKFGTSIVDDINELINEQFIDLIILGTHGATGIRKVLFGSNTASIIENTHCPVLAIPHHYKFKGIQNLAYAAADLSNVKKELKKVIPMVQKLDASLAIFHIQDAKTHQKMIDTKEITLSLSHHFKFYKMHLDIIEDLEDNTQEAIEKYVKKHKLDILIMLHQKRGFFGRLFLASQTKEIAHKLNVPLLAIK